MKDKLFLFAHVLFAKEPGIIPRKKREYKKRKHKQPVVPTVTPAPPAAVHLPNYVDVSMVLHRSRAVSSDDDLSVRVID
jgi:hypothetical protein